MVEPLRELTTRRLRLRRWRPEDREPYACMNADPRVMQFFPGLVSREESDASADRIEQYFREHGYGLWAVEIPGEASFAGFIGLWTPRFEAPFTPCTEIGWRLAAEYWGRGLATEGARAVLQTAFQTIGLAEVVAMTVAGNIRSRRVMEKLHMSYSPADDFEHPLIAPGNGLSLHVLYRITREKYESICRSRP